MPKSPPPSTLASTMVVESQAKVPSASGASVGMRKADAVSRAIGASGRMGQGLLLAAGGERANDLTGRGLEDADLVRIALQERVGELLRLVERDVRRQRRHVRVGLEGEDHRPVGGQR